MKKTSGKGGYEPGKVKIKKVKKLKVEDWIELKKMLDESKIDGGELMPTLAQQMKEEFMQTLGPQLKDEGKKERSEEQGDQNREPEKKTQETETKVDSEVKNGI